MMHFQQKVMDISVKGCGKRNLQLIVVENFSIVIELYTTFLVVFLSSSRLLYFFYTLCLSFKSFFISCFSTLGSNQHLGC